MRLVTYLPFYRIYEVEEYFLKNVESIKPKEALVYVDNVFHTKQIDILKRIIPESITLKTGNWKSRSGTWFAMLKDLQGLEDVAFIDSDNLLDSSFLEADAQMDYIMYTVLDKESWSRGAPNIMIRSKKIGRIIVNGQELPVYSYKVYEPNIIKKGTVLFIGPKQAVIYRRLPEPEIINKVERAFMLVPSEYRPFISDEVVLGILAYESGIYEVPWIVMSTHMHHGSDHPASLAKKTIVASAHLKFAKSLKKEFNRKEIWVYELKYMFSLIKDIPKLF